MKRITFSAEAYLIDAARERARREGTTLNAVARRWLEEYGRREDPEQAMSALRDLQQPHSTGGRRFTRDEMNER